MNVFMIQTGIYGKPTVQNGKAVKARVKFQGAELEVDHHVNVYAYGGQTYDLPDDVAKEWLKSGVARAVNSPKSEAEELAGSFAPADADAALK